MFEIVKYNFSMFILMQITVVHLVQILWKLTSFSVKQWYAFDVCWPNILDDSIYFLI